MQSSLGCELSLLTTSREIRPGSFKSYRGIFCLQAEERCQSWRTASSAANCSQISLPVAQGKENFLLGTEPGYSQRGQAIPEDRARGAAVWTQWEKDSAEKLFWEESFHFKHKEHSATQVSKLSLFGTTHDSIPRELKWCKTNLRDRTSATVLTIPFSRRQGSNTAIVFWPAAPLEGSHIFTQTWGQVRISVASMYKPPARITLKHLLRQTEKANSDYSNFSQPNPGSVTPSFSSPGGT